jgi:hypothetical protein
MVPNLNIFLRELIDAWNSHKLENILSHYSEDFELISPIIKKKLEIDDGTIRGKAKVRDWWQRVLNKVPDFTLELVDFAIASDSSIAMIARSSHNQKLVVSEYSFDDKGKILREKYFD